jgi:3',5'-cyclic AMP phosphodiesterase CpdA
VLSRWALVVSLLAAGVVCSCDGPSHTAPEIIVGSDTTPLLSKTASLKFAVIGDSGRWSAEQRQTASQLAAQYRHEPFDFVLMLGDNNYGDGSPESFRTRFEEPFQALLDAHVRFYAARGNHDVGPQWNYPLFNMGGHRYYTFERTSGLAPPLVGTVAQFFAVDTVNLDEDELSWLDRQLSESKAEWKIVFQHHPLYSSGRYSFASAFLRRTLEQTFVEHQVDVVFAGHEHVYERMVPQRGIVYFVAGAAGSVRVGDLRPSAYQAKGYDRDLSFMLIQLSGASMHFQAITRTGETIDSGTIIRKKASS